MPGSGRQIVPWFPVRSGVGGMGHCPGRFPLRDDDRCRPLLRYCRYRLVERCPAAVAEDRLASRIGSPAGRTGCIPGDRFLFECCSTAGAEPGLVINGRAAAPVAYDRYRWYSRTAPVAVLCQFVGNYGAAPGADRECRRFLFGHGGTAPVAELGLVIERRVAALTTGFCHILPLVDKTGWSINTVMLFFTSYQPALMRVFVALQNRA